MNKNRKITVKSLLLGVVSAIGIFFVFGIPTRLIPNPWFVRMIPANAYDYVFLILSSLLLGAYFGVNYYKKKVSVVCTTSNYAGGIGSFLAFGCPICNKLLLLLFGATALMTYLEPYRPALGIVSNSVLIGALYWRVKN